MQIKADDYSDGLLIMFLLGQAASNSAFSITGVYRIGMKPLATTAMFVASYG